MEYTLNGLDGIFANIDKFIAAMGRGMIEVYFVNDELVGTLILVQKSYYTSEFVHYDVYKFMPSGKWEEYTPRHPMSVINFIAARGESILGEWQGEWYY